MTKKKKIVITCSVVGAFLLACIIAALICLQMFYGIFKKGNLPKYGVNNIEVITDSPLKGKMYYFLGSSVTYGMASMGQSMADFIAKRNDCTCVKEAVSGTTLADINNKSYVSRIKNFDTSRKIDGFICQLSTNDIGLENKGSVSQSFDIDDLDKSTTYGAIEYIIAYARAMWNCPIYFYTGSYYENDIYAEMVDTLYEIAEKWNITVIDLFTDKDFNTITDEQRALYMNDDVHPTKAGYRDWWTPKIEEYIKQQEEK